MSDAYRAGFDHIVKHGFRETDMEKEWYFWATLDGKRPKASFAYSPYFPESCQFYTDTHHDYEEWKRGVEVAIEVLEDIREAKRDA